MRQPRTKTFPYSVSLPKAARSPSGSIYKDFDIIWQHAVINTWDGSQVIRSTKPFAVRVQVGAKIKEIVAHA